MNRLPDSRFVNPAYANRRLTPPPKPSRPVQYARLPQVPINSSPVPHLTSLYHFSRAGEYGDRSYPGNCGGNLIKDLLLYFRPSSVFDPMMGSGTCRDVCRELGVSFTGGDIHAGFDACDPAHWPATRNYQFIWSHPPYWRQKIYAVDPRDLEAIRKASFGSNTIVE